MTHWVGGAAYVFDKDHSLLLIRRRSSSGNEIWMAPGGATEPGELIPHGVIREVKEETGLEVELEGLIQVDEWQLDDGRNALAFVYMAKPLLEEPVIDTSGWVPEEQDNLLEVRFVPQEDVQRLKLRPSHHRLLLERLLKGEITPVPWPVTGEQI